MSTENIVTMPPPDLRQLLMDAPPGRHIAQLHKNTTTLTDSVCEFIGTGLQKGDAVIAVASVDNTELYVHRLRELGLRPSEARRSGQLTLLDTQETMSKFMRSGMPKWEEFRATIGPIIETVQANKNWKSTRVYGEMVSDLWRASQTGASIRLEIYWNEIARLYRFCLLCCYEMGGLEKSSFMSAQDTIGRTHSHVLPTAH